MKEAFLYVAIILFLIDTFFWWRSATEMPGGRLTPLGLTFFAAHFLAIVPG